MPTTLDRHGRHRFAIGPLLGAGTFGEVYLARLTSLHGIEQDVAVKLLNPGVDPRSQPVSRMRDEGHMLAGLNHPAILQVMDLCFLEGRIGLVTEFVPGADLDDCIHGEHPLPVRAALQVIGAVADALHAAFESRTADGARLGLVHRDVKPANIRITPHGSVKLLDFGIAKSEDLQRETATQQRAAFGTPAYMAPEVLSYEVLEALGSRDVFALGCTLYEAIVRERYFEGLDHQAIGRLSNREERFREWRLGRMGRLAGQRPDVVELLDRMLAYDHTERPPARDVAGACLAMADSLQGASLWAWARERRWPPVSSSAGPWTGRTVVDTQFGLADAQAPSRRPAAVPPEAPDAPAERAGSTQGFLAAPAPRAQRERETPTEPDAASWSAGGPESLLLLASAFIAVALLMALVVVWLRTDVVVGMIDGAAVPEVAHAEGASIGRSQRGARTADTAVEPPPTPDGGPARVWGAGERGHGAVTVTLAGDHDVRILAPDRRPVRLAPWGSVEAPEGPIEVQARFRSRHYQWQFETVLVPGRTLEIVCDADLATCDPAR